MKSVLVKLGWLLFEIGTSIVIRVIFDSQTKKQVESIVSKLESSTMDGKEKYKVVKEYIDQLKGDAPEVAKNILIEAAVAKLDGQKIKLANSIRKRL